MAAMPNKPNANWIKWKHCQTKNGFRPQKGKTCLLVQSPVGQQPKHSDCDDEYDDDNDDDDNDDDGDDDDGDGYLGNPLPKKDQSQHSLLTKTMTKTDFLCR